ncbi:hypothetical protein BYT27DRAFT_6738786 [Phlegmacium glaucopus]|nr:hypothetical protein BYT27DRAFT_6738786 [Phlegmacium glaucopus]
MQNPESTTHPTNTESYFDVGPGAKECSLDHKDILQTTIDSPRDWNTPSNSQSLPSDVRGDMSDSSIPRQPKPRQSRTQQKNPQRRSTPRSTPHLPPSPQVPFEITQHFIAPSHQAHGGNYIGQYTMPPHPTPMGAIHSPPYGFSHTYRPPTVPDSSVMPQNPHNHYQSLSQHPHAGPMYQYQQHSREGNSTLHSSFPGTPMYPTHQANALGPPTSPHSTPSTVQNSPLSPPYIGSGVFHSYPSPMSTPHYTYSPSFAGPPTYQSQYPPPQFRQRYTTNRGDEPQGDWYYVPRHSTVAPSQQYDAGPSYTTHYPATYPRIQPELNDGYSANSFSSANSSTPYLNPPIRTFSHHSEAQSPEMFHSSAASVSSGEHLPNDRPIVRQPYHPNPPPHRSEWVMWAGNIPSDATHDEIYRFFNQAPEDRASGPTASMGVVSVFLISRSNCAFINFESENCLLGAISRFNGVPLRASDVRCARLVCRVRRKDDDLKAGVGGQRGTGMHTRWVKEQKQKTQEKTKHDQSAPSVSGHSSPSSIVEQLANWIPNISLSGDESGLGQDPHAKRSSTSDSYSSSNSNFLARHFPKRYFILKSLTQHDLDLSVQTGVWATQKHNEGILDQSYRTSKDVYLIFGVNKSGEFYGYARMAGPVRRGGQNVPWAPSPPRSHQPPISGRLSSQSSGPNFFSPGDHRLVDSSPLSLDTKTTTDLHLPQYHPQSAPSMLGQKYDIPSMKTPETKYSLDQQRPSKVKNPLHAQKDDFELDPAAPLRAMRSTGGKSGSRGTSLHSLEKVEERGEEPDEGAQEPTFLHEHHDDEGKSEDSWGDCFAVEWISTEKLSFNRTRHIRNPWNHDREVKISRDGTELEPTVGQTLLDEWHKLSEPHHHHQQQQHQSVTSAGGVGSGHEGGSKPAGSSSRRLTTAEHRPTREGKEAD